MPSTFFGLNTAYTGLNAANVALNTTGNNISNAETKGYSKQQVVQKAADAIRTFTTYGCAGAGVQTLSIERLRDEFYDEKYWNSSTITGGYEMKQYYMAQVETYFKDDSTVDGFQTIFDNMMTALGEVMKNAGSSSTKSQFVGSADNLAEYFNSMSENLSGIQSDANKEMKLKVDEINAISSEISILNKQINIIEVGGGTANELRDERTKLVDQLSTVVSVEVRETPIYDTNYPDRQTGANLFTVSIAGGQPLVNGSDYHTLACVSRANDEKVNQSDVDGLYDIYWVSSGSDKSILQEFNLNNKNIGGELAGLIAVRDGNNGEYFNGTVTGINTSVPGANTVTIKVTADYLKDLNKGTLSDSGGKINIGNQTFYYDSWNYQYDAGTNTTSYTFTLDSTKGDNTLDASRLGKTASTGSAVDYQGIPYYMEQMNEWVRTFAASVNKILKSGYDEDGNAGTILFTGDKATSTGQYSFSTGYNTGANESVSSIASAANGDSYYQLTAKNFNVLAAMVKDADLLATKATASAGQDDFSILKKITTMVSDKTVTSFRGASANEFLTCILSDVALNANSANTFYTNSNNMKTSIETQRLSISGVDKDEEAIDLVKYQNSYTLASKMIQTLTEVYDRLILQTGV